MDLRHEALLVALLERIITARAAAEPLSRRPDWCGHLEMRLAQLHHIQPSIVWFLKEQTGRVNPINPIAPLQSAIQRATITQSDLVRADRGWTLTPELPLEPGEVAITLMWGLDTSEEEFVIKAREMFREGKASLEDMYEQRRRAALERERAHAMQVRAAAAEGGPEAELFEALAAAADERVTQLEKPPRATRQRLGDRLARDMWFLRRFLHTGDKPTAVAAAWGAVLERWSVAGAVRDPIDAHAAAEWRRAGATDEPQVDAAEVSRRLKKWLGPTLGPNRLVRPDPTGPNGFRAFCALDPRLKREGPVAGPSMCHGLTGRAHQLFHERRPPADVTG